MADEDGACSVCVRLERSRHFDLLRLGRELLVPPPLSNTDTVLACRCPECGVIYRYECTTDDMDVFEHLERTTWLDGLALLPRAEREALAGERGARVARWQRELEHENGWFRREAARNLTDIACADADWPALVALLASARAGVPTFACEVLQLENVFVDAPDNVIVALRAIDAPSATWILAAIDFVRSGLADLSSLDAERARARLTELTRRVEWLPDASRARLVPLLAHPDEPTRAGVLKALLTVAHELERGTEDALFALLAGSDVVAALGALTVLARSHTPRAAALTEIERWLREPRTSTAACALLVSQAGAGVDLSPVGLALVAALAGPDGRLAARALTSSLSRSRPAPAPVLAALLRALGEGVERAVEPLEAAARVWALGPFEAELRALFDRAPSESPRRRALARMLVHVSASRRDGLSEWLFHGEPAVVEAAAFAARSYSAEPYFDRLVALALAGSFGAREWLVTWGMRAPENARRVLAALPEVSPRSQSAAWRELVARARR